MDKLIPTLRGSVLSTDKELIPARNATDAHVQDFMVSDKSLLTILKAFVPSLVHCTLLVMPDEPSLSGLIQLVIMPTNKNSVFPAIASSLSHRARHADTPVETISWFVACNALRFKGRNIQENVGVTFSLKVRILSSEAASCSRKMEQSGKVNNSLFSYHSVEPETEASVAA